MRYLLLLLLAVVLPLQGAAQSDTDILAKAQAEAIAMVEAYAKGDYDAFIDRLPPKLIALSGGREAMKDVFKKGPAPGVKIGAVKVSPPDALVRADGTLQCALEEYQEMEINGQRVFVRSYMIGLSRDGGVHWEFISVSDHSLAEVREMFPEVSTELNVRPQTAPQPVAK